MQINDGWDLNVGDLVAIRKTQWLGGTIGVITQIIVPRKQFFVHWLTVENVGTMCTYRLIEPIGGDNENR
jgi:hypothetical protein